jgi:site-specific DNA recombinase
MLQRRATTMLTVAYCRVSTEEQAEEGFSVEGQADKLRSYAELRELGSVTVIADPGISGKSLNRPGVQHLLEAVEAGYVTTVLVWRLDRLSRNLQDLILLADLFGTHGVALHSVSENLDLSSAAGRMFYNILGTFAQYFREQLAENVKMGNERALREGRYINRPKFGYDLDDGQLVPNEKAVIVREIFRLRAEGESYRTIEERTGVLYSSVSSILQSRVYVGERPRHGGYLPGSHEPIVTGEEWQAANKRLRRGRHTSTDPLAGHVVCGLCSKRMAVAQNGQGSRAYKCQKPRARLRHPSAIQCGTREGCGAWASAARGRRGPPSRDSTPTRRRRTGGGGGRRRARSGTSPSSDRSSWSSTTRARSRPRASTRKSTDSPR